MSDLYTLQDPTTQYAQPPFDYQPQRAPGLAHEMLPRPDHGETSYRGSGRFRNRKALITGGDSGIGRAAAIAFAREGADIAINYLPSEEKDAEEVIALIEQEGRRAISLPGNIADEALSTNLVRDAHKALAGLDTIVCVAGKQHWVNHIEDLTTEQFEQTYRVNVFALFWLCKAALPLIPRGGSIITTASYLAAQPSPILLDYSSTKAAILAFTRSLARQVAGTGIRVNCVAPGPVWTPLQTSGGESDEDLTNYGSNTPMKRPGQPVEIAPLYVLLASQEASYVTGEVFAATGGLEMS